MSSPQLPGARTSYSIYVPSYPMLYNLDRAERLDERIRNVYKVMALPRCTLPLGSVPPSNHVNRHIVAAELGISRKHIKVVREHGYKGSGTSRWVILVRGPDPRRMRNMVAYYDNKPDDRVGSGVLGDLSRGPKCWHRLCYAEKTGSEPPFRECPRHRFLPPKYPGEHDEEELFAFFSVALLKHEDFRDIWVAPSYCVFEEIKRRVSRLIRNLHSEASVLEQEEWCNGHKIRESVNKLCKSMSVTPHEWKGSRYIHSYLSKNHLHRTFLKLMARIEAEIPGTMKICRHQGTPEITLMQEYTRRVSTGLDRCIAEAHHYIHRRDDGLFYETASVDNYEKAADELSELAVAVNRTLEQVEELRVAKRIHADRQDTAMGCGSALWTHR